MTVCFDALFNHIYLKRLETRGRYKICRRPGGNESGQICLLLRFIRCKNRDIFNQMLFFVWKKQIKNISIKNKNFVGLRTNWWELNPEPTIIWFVPPGLQTLQWSLQNRILNHIGFRNTRQSFALNKQTAANRATWHQFSYAKRLRQIWFSH